MPDEDPSWSHYPETIILIDRVLIDLRIPVVDPGLRRLRELGTGPQVAIITAFNPRGIRAVLAENELRHRRLATALLESGAVHLLAAGMSPDRRHRESGFAVWLSIDQCRSLAEKFEQSAFFWFDGRGFWIVGAAAATPPVQLPCVQG